MRRRTNSVVSSRSFKLEEGVMMLVDGSVRGVVAVRLCGVALLLVVFNSDALFCW